MKPSLLFTSQECGVNLHYAHELPRHRVPHDPGADGGRAGQRAGDRGVATPAALGLAAVRHARARRRCATSWPRSAPQTDRPFNVNFFCHAPPAPDAEREAAWRAALAPYYEELGIDPRADPGRRRGARRSPPRPPTCSSEFRPAVVSFHFGLPSAELLARVRALGREDPLVGDHGRRGALARSARRRRDHRAGRRGGRPSRHVPVRRPDARRSARSRWCRRSCSAVEGAGDRRRRHRRRARASPPRMALGAAGVQVGTAYLLCPEATTSAVHRAALEERRRAPHRAHQPVHRPAGARHRQPRHARARADQRRGARVSARRRGDRAAARQGREPRAAATSRRCGPGRTRPAAGKFRRAS